MIKRLRIWLQCIRWKSDKLKEVIGEEEKKQIGLDLAVQKAVEIVTEAAVEK